MIWAPLPEEHCWPADFWGPRPGRSERWLAEEHPQHLGWALSAAPPRSLVFALSPTHQLSPVTQHEANLSPPSRTWCPAPPVLPGCPWYPWSLTLGPWPLAFSQRQQVPALLGNMSCQEFAWDQPAGVLGPSPQSLLLDPEPRLFLPNFSVCVCEMGITTENPTSPAARDSSILGKALSVTASDNLLGQYQR